MLWDCFPKARRYHDVSMMNIPLFSEKRSRLFVGILAGIIVMIVGLIDYLTGYEIIFSVFYLLAIIPATWFGGKALGFLLSILSVGVWILGDLAAGGSHLQLSPFVIWWNVLIQVAFDFILVYLIDKLHRSYEDLELKIQERTQALRDEMVKRERLEKEILGISEREQRRIGCELHDTLCQHLTGTALAAQVLHERLAAKSIPEAYESGIITDLIEEGIGMTRNMARGLSPIDMQVDGLMAALRNFADGISRRYGIPCRFESDGVMLVHDATQAINLFRIAQEAVTNAIKHSKAGKIQIRLFRESGRIVMTVYDNGKGLPDELRRGQGMGIQIMEHRASIIGATFSCGSGASGGTKIVCTIPDDECLSNELSRDSGSSPRGV